MYLIDVSPLIAIVADKKRGSANAVPCLNLGLRKEVRDFCLQRNRREQHGTMTMSRLTLETHEGTWLLGGELDHLSGLHHGFGQVELASVDAPKILVPPGTRRRPPLRRSTEHFQMN